MSSPQKKYWLHDEPAPKFLPLLLIPGSAENHIFCCKFDRQINFITVHTIPFPVVHFFPSSEMCIWPTLQNHRVRFSSCFFQLSGCGRPRMARRSLPDLDSGFTLEFKIEPFVFVDALWSAFLSGIFFSGINILCRKMWCSFPKIDSVQLSTSNYEGLNI